MKMTFKLGAIAASAWLGISAVDLSAQDFFWEGYGDGYAAAYDPQYHWLTVVGDERDNRIKVSLAADGAILVNGNRIDLSKFCSNCKTPPAVAIAGGGGKDVLVSDHLPYAAMSGGDGVDLLIWINSEEPMSGDIDGNDYIYWNRGSGIPAYGGAGIDVLIANTGGDRLLDIGDLGNDWIVGGTGRD